MYNVEKYIGALLESLLAQTFQNFEVVVVDNGSTDNSAAVLKSYVPKFGGRLKTSRIEKNSGGPSPAYNKAVALSRGKYVYVIDSDDLLVNNALEELYSFAENYDADVVYIEKEFRFITDPHNPFPGSENIRLCASQTGVLHDKPIFETNNLTERVKKFSRFEIGFTAWEKLVRRVLLIENDITFPLIKSGGDVAWTIQLLCCAKNFLRVPNAYYLYRQNPTSIMNRTRTAREEIDFWSGIDIEGIKFLDEWLSAREFFQQNLQCKLDLMEAFDRVHFKFILNAASKLEMHEVYEVLESKFNSIFSDSGKVIAYLCTSLNLSRLRLLMANQRIAELENQLKQIQGS